MPDSTDETSTTADVVAYAADLMFASRIRGAARAAGVGAVIVTKAADLPDRVRSGAPRLVLVDLDARGGDGVEAISALKLDESTCDVPLVAFASHLAAERILAAREAGADRVLARSAFIQELPALLRGAADQ